MKEKSCKNTYFIASGGFSFFCAALTQVGKKIMIIES